MCLFVQMGLISFSFAQSYIVADAHTGRVFLAQDTERKSSISDLVKVASAMVVLDWARVAKEDLNQLVTVNVPSVSFGGGNPMGLQVGDRLSMRDAIYSGLLGSDHVAIHALASHVGGKMLKHRQRAGDPVGEFMHELGQLTRALVLKKTKFGNPHGLDLPKEYSYSTASDMAVLSVYAMRDAGFAYYVKQKSRTLSVFRQSGKKETFTVKSTNQLLGKKGVIGGKTGFSSSAGQCLMVATERPSIVKKYGDGRSSVIPRRLVSVLLNSGDRFAEMNVLLSQGVTAYDQWAGQGYPSSSSRKEYLVLPQRTR